MTPIKVREISDPLKFYVWVDTVMITHTPYAILVDPKGQIHMKSKEEIEVVHYLDLMGKAL